MQVEHATAEEIKRIAEAKQKADERLQKIMLKEAEEKRAEVLQHIQN